MTSRRRRRGSSPAAPQSPLEDEDLLMEILLRLPREPSSLPRASAVGKQWGRLAADPKFLARFRAHHGKPPLLGVFELGYEIKFRSFLDPPDRIPPERFSLGRYSNPRRHKMLACRHGRVLVEDGMREEVVVCDPITGKQHRVSIPPKFNEPYHKLNGTVLCAAGDQGHVHVSCHSCPFKVVLVSEVRTGNSKIACVYCSETGIWGDIISTEAPHYIFNGDPTPSTLVGNVLYWPSNFGRDNILQFDLDSQNLTVIKGPHCMNDKFIVEFQIIQAEDGVVGLVVLSCNDLQMWKRKVDCKGVAIWLRQKTVALHNILELPPKIRKRRELHGQFVGHDEDNNAVLLYMHGSVYMVQLKSMQSNKLKGIDSAWYLHPFTSFYPPGRTITAEYGAKMVG